MTSCIDPLRLNSIPGMFAPLDLSVNECYAFHGTFVRYALSIAENDARQGGIRRNDGGRWVWVALE